MNKCLYCGKPVKNKYCDVSCQNKHQSIDKTNKRFGELKSFNVLCKKCGKEFEVEEREKLFPKKEFYYCSKKCANSRNHSEEVKKKISKSVIKTFSELFPKKQYTCLYCGESFENSKYRRFCSDNCRKKYYDEKYSYTCPNCGKIFRGEKRSKFCSMTCATSWGNKNSDRAIIGGKASVLSQNKRSKNEIYFSELCCSFFNNVKLNEPIFNGWDADVILNDYKLAILWDGNWHHKQIGIKHSLLQVQNRDKIKIKEIIKFGFGNIKNYIYLCSIKYMRGDRCPRSLINFLFCGQFTASLLKIKRLKIKNMKNNMNICESYRNIIMNNDDENIVPLDW